MIVRMEIHRDCCHCAKYLGFLLMVLVHRMGCLPLGGREGEGGRPAGWSERSDAGETAEEDLSPSEQIYIANQELIWNHKDHWVEMDIVKDQRVRGFLERALGPDSEPGLEGPPPMGEEEDGSNITTRAAIAFRNMLWPEGIVPYAFDAFVGKDSREVVYAAIGHWENHTCIRFVPRQEERDYILFVEHYGCWSYVGKRPRGGAQMLSVGVDGSPCRNPGVIVHELGHAIGFWHEQSRPDRDRYIRVIWNNILPGTEYNFYKYPRSEINSLDVEYDFSSIMHYPATAFARNGNLTIVPRQPDQMDVVAKMGQRRGLSPLDIRQANLMYNCPVLDRPATGEGDNEGMTIEIPDDAFQIQLWNTSSCLSAWTKEEEEEEESTSHTRKIATILAACSSSSIDQFWKWRSPESDQLLSIGTQLCLTSVEDASIALMPCDDNVNAKQQWFCAGRYLEQRQSGQCVSAMTEDEEDNLEDELDRFTNGNSIEQTFQHTAFVTLTECTAGSRREWWGAVNATSIDTEPLSLCAHAPSHIIPRCYFAEKTSHPATNQSWIGCFSKGYYTKIFHGHNGVEDTMECRASTDVFTGQPDSPAVAPGEECEDERWNRFADATDFEGGFHCPEGFFLKGVLISSLGGIDTVRCCKPSTSMTSYNYCFVDENNQRKDHGISKCSLPGYRITAVQKTDCNSSECMEAITCCD